MAEEITFEDKIRAWLYHGLLDNTLKVGEAITISKLARAIGTNTARTRGIIQRLEHSGVAENITGKEFTLTKKAGEAARQVLYLIGVLEEFALCEVCFPQEELADLHARIDDFSKQRKQKERFLKDLAFHEKLASRCPNDISSELLKDIRIIVFPFIYNALKQKDYRFRTQLIYRQVVELLEEEEWEDAGKLIRAYWKLLADDFIKPAVKDKNLV